MIESTEQKKQQKSTKTKEKNKKIADEKRMSIDTSWADYVAPGQ